MKKRDITRAMSIMGKKGATQRTAKVSPERRKEIAKAAAAARWKKEEPPKG